MHAVALDRDVVRERGWIVHHDLDLAGVCLQRALVELELAALISAQPQRRAVSLLRWGLPGLFLVLILGRAGDDSSSDRRHGQHDRDRSDRDCPETGPREVLACDPNRGERDRPQREQRPDYVEGVHARKLLQPGDPPHSRSARNRGGPNLTIVAAPPASREVFVDGEREPPDLGDQREVREVLQTCVLPKRARPAGVQQKRRDVRRVHPADQWAGRQSTRTLVSDRFLDGRMMPPGSPVQCPACGHLSREGARFCANCAEPLFQEVACPRCGASNKPDQNFCDRCGTLLVEHREAPAPDPRSYTPDHLAEKIRTAKRSLEGERKQITVLFADVKGSMELGEGMDPEAWRRIIERMFTLMCEGVHRFEGTVNRFTGDGMVALFGAPIAHEDHAQRACHAALYLSDQLARYAEQLKREEGLDFSVRMGLNSGEVVVGAIGDDLQMDYTAIGHSVGLGQRMERLAQPGTAYLTEHTAALISGYFELRDKGVVEVKGVRTPLRVYELAGTGAARTRLEVAGARGFTRFVGRESELASLKTALDRVVAGTGQVVGVVSEPGLGKSRLCYELVRRFRGRGIKR